MKVSLIAAMTLDGFIGQTKDQVSTSWTSKEDKQFFAERTKAAGVIVLGSQTYRTFNRLLPGRRMIILTRDVAAFRASVELEVVELSAATTVLNRQDVLYVTCLQPSELVAVLAKIGIPELGVCGGSQIYTQFLAAGLIDELYLTIEPVLFGAGVPLFSEAMRTQLELLEIKKLSELTILLQYQVKK